MAQAGGGNAWHVEKPDDLQQIFQVELEGLVSQVAHTVSLGMIPADGARIVDLLNDFELTETGRYRLPNLQAGSPLDVVVQIRLNAQPENSRMRLLDLRLGLTPQGEGKAEVLKLVHEIEFVSHAEFESLPINDEVIKVVQFLMNARARREAMRRLDAQDFVGAQHVLSQARVSTAALCAGRPGVSAECASLAQAEQSLTDRLKDKLSRKRLAYEAYKRSTGK
jgi:Ca-activated chloride channel family protein